MPTNDVTFQERLQYAFDNYMSKGTKALIGGLVIFSVIIIFIAALVVQITQTGPENKGFVDLLWMSMMRTFDAGTMGGDTGDWTFLLSMLFVTIGGIFVISMLIGVLSNGMESKIEELQKGRSRVIENNHTIILGWSEQVYRIVSELAIANENVKKPCIVIMGEKDKTEMEDAIRERADDLKNTRIVCRTGSPIELADLDIVNLNTSKSIIILSPDSEDPDSNVIKIILAIVNNPKRRSEPYHIIAPITKTQNMDVARMVGKDEVELIFTGDLIARMIAQTCRQSGLSTIYTELMDFGGDEIYFKSEPTLIGKTYGEALLAFEASTVIGLSPNGKIPMLNPPMDMHIEPGTEIIAISEDDDTILVSGKTNLDINETAIQTSTSILPKSENIFILGWNWRVPAIIRELDNYVTPGSTLTLVADLEEEEEIRQQIDKLNNLSVTYQNGDINDRATLDQLPFDKVKSVILMSYSDRLEAQQADSQTLITLLHLRDIADKNGYSYSIVSEMMDIRNRRLAAITRADDFVISNRMISLLMAQISEEKRLAPVFTDIFDPEGSEIYLKPAANYIRPGETVNFYTVIEAARRQGHTAIGYCLKDHAQNASKAYGIVINPKKSEPITLSEKDKVIVFSES